MFAQVIHELPSFVLALAVGYCLSLLIYPLLQWHSQYQFFAISGVLMALIECPHFVSTEQLALRGFAALFCADYLFRSVDFVRHQRSSNDRASWSEFWRFLIPFPILLVVFKLKQRSLRTTERNSGVELLRLAAGGTVMTVAVLIVIASHSSPLFTGHFLLDHVVKVGLFLFFIEAAAQFMLGLERLAGFSPKPFVDRCFLSKTPAEFWIRYNQRVQQWLYFNVFVPSGGRRQNARGVMLVFLVSAIFHELMFGIVTSRFDGYQATFFLLQIPAVLISYPMGQLAARYGNIGSATARLLTIFWFVFTSLFFFHGFDRVFPFFYAARPWLP